VNTKRSEKEKEKVQSPPILSRTFSFGQSKDVPYSSSKDLKNAYTKLRGQSFADIHKLFPKVREITKSNVSLHTARDPTEVSLNIVVAQEN